MTVTSATATASGSDATSTNALASISSNYNEFLTLLTTQLQNQDPSNPADTSQFTSELAQFAGVQQQVGTNTNLTSLIQLTQSQQVLQGASILGKQVDLDSTTFALQGGNAHLDYTSPTAQDVQIAVSNSSGTVVDTQTVAAAAGSNGYDWKGLNTSGIQEADGAYTVAVTAAPTAGASTGAPLDFTTRGTVTGLARSGSTIDLKLGATSVDMSTVSNVHG